MLTSLIFAWMLLCFFPGSLTQFTKLYPNQWLQQDFYGADFPGITRVFTDGIYGVYWNGLSHFNVAVWTMQKELIGSIFIYIVYSFISASSLRLVLIACMGAALLQPIYLGFPLGVCLREAWVRGYLRETKWGWGAMVLGIMIACNDGTFLFSKLAGIKEGGALYDYCYCVLYSIGAVLVVSSLLMSVRLREAFSLRIPRFLGRISFSLYLIHLPLITSVCTFFAVRLPGENGGAIVLLGVSFLTVCLSLAWLMTVALDEPLMVRLKYLKNLRLG